MDMIATKSPADAKRVARKLMNGARYARRFARHLPPQSPQRRPERAPHNAGKRVSLTDLRAMFSPHDVAPAPRRKPNTLVHVGLHRGINVFRDMAVPGSRSKYTPHNGKTEALRRAVRIAR